MPWWVCVLRAAEFAITQDGSTDDASGEVLLWILRLLTSLPVFTFPVNSQRLWAAHTGRLHRLSQSPRFGLHSCVTCFLWTDFFLPDLAHILMILSCLITFIELRARWIMHRWWWMLRCDFKTCWILLCQALRDVQLIESRLLCFLRVIWLQEEISPVNDTWSFWGLYQIPGY